MLSQPATSNPVWTLPSGHPNQCGGADPVTYDFITRSLCRTMGGKLKILNGSPGRARTADLVINSRIYSML